MEASSHGMDFGGPLADLAQVPWITIGFPLVVPKWSFFSTPRHVAVTLIAACVVSMKYTYMKENHSNNL